MRFKFQGVSYCKYYFGNIVYIKAAELPQNGIAVECIAPSSCRELSSVRESPGKRIFSFESVTVASVIND